jgi:hypothetical protein
MSGTLLRATLKLNGASDVKTSVLGRRSATRAWLQNVCVAKNVSVKSMRYKKTKRQDPKHEATTHLKQRGKR